MNVFAGCEAGFNQICPITRPVHQATQSFSVPLVSTGAILRVGGGGNWQPDAKARALVQFRADIDLTAHEGHQFFHQ